MILQITAVEFVSEYGLVGGLVLVIVFLGRLVLDEDRAALWRGRVSRAAFAVTGRREDEKNYIANDLKGRLNLARRKLHYSKSSLPLAIDVEWLDVESQETYEIREDEYIVKLNPATEQRANIVCLAEAMVQRTTLRGLRHLTAPGLQQAIDTTMIRKLLDAIGSKEVLDYFLSAVYGPLRVANEEFREWDEKVVHIDEQGLYERLLLVELEDFGRRIAALAPRPYMLGELEQLVSFVHRLATKSEGEDVPLDYVKAHVRIGVVLVAKSDKLLREGAAPYIEAVRRRSAGVDVIYVIIWQRAWQRTRFLSDQYNRFSIELAKEIRGLPGLKHDFTVPYRYTDPRGKPGEGLISRLIVVGENAAA